jgi:hypothetical protein
MRACHALWAYRAMGRFGNYVTAAVVAFCGAFLLWQGVPGPWAYLLFAGVAVFVALDLIRDRLWRRYFRGLEKYRGPLTATVDDNGVGVDSAEGVHVHPWSVFRSFVSTDAFIFLIIDQRQFSVIPKDAFESPAQATTFEGIVADHLKRMPRRHF